MDHAIKPVSVPPGGGDCAGVAEGDLTGKVLGDFQVLRRLGQGGMGQVYLAEQISLKRKVALKLLRPDLAADAAALQRFKAEAEAVARATHANIVQVYAIGEAEGLHYMALEYVEGRNLREYLEKKGPPEVLVALSIIRQVASALQRASELGIIHRDIKPENILLTRKGEVKVTDFGLSRCFGGERRPVSLTQSGVAMGTPLYMSPEQVEGKPVDPRTDIYSFGVTCYHMLAGQPPFQGQSPFEVAVQHVQAEPRPLAEIRPDLPPALCAVVHKMMAKRPEDRYQTAREIVQDVTHLRDGVVGVTSLGEQLLATSLGAIQAAGSSGLTATVPPKSRWWLKWAAAGSIVLALAAGGAVAWHLNQSTEPSRKPDPKSGTAAETEPLIPLRKEREKLLVEELRHYQNPGEDRERTVWGIKHGIELALLYLEDWRLEEADQLFRELDSPGRVDAYRTLGQMGRAIVLAFRDRTKESNLLFLKVLFPGKQPNKPKNLWYYYQLIRANPEFRRMIARALDHNFFNNPAAFPNTLEPYRRPPTPSGKARKG
jgi:serine/threonine-protein kinase